MAVASAVKGKLIAVIGDEDTTIGFLMSGAGEMNKLRQPNYFIYDKSKIKKKKDFPFST